MKRITRNAFPALLIALACLLLVGGTALAMNSANYSINRHSINSGGARGASANYSANSTLGQTVVGSSASANYRMASGFWQATGGAPAPPPPPPTPVPGVSGPGLWVMAGLFVAGAFWALRRTGKPTG